MVCSTVGSLTSTGWKRRSSAASFSTCFWYSLSVVAPMRCSSPRASIGLNALAMSRPPSPPVAPAPTMVCSSSMKRIRLSCWAEISSRSCFTRSSNWPRYWVPATSEVTISSTTRLPRNGSGTSPASMRWARPSTMAVFPTPGSPINTGLFFLRRERISMTVSISCARPITGSSLPCLASALRSRLTLSRLGVSLFPSTRPSSAPLPTTRTVCWRSASGVRPYRRSRSLASPSSAARPMSRCSGPR